MQDNRNASCQGSVDNRGTVCIDTKRVYDSCRDRDCFEDVRVYLTCMGEEVIANSTSVRTKSAKIISTYVGVNDIPFNNGFYQVTVRYFIEIEFEGCLGVGKSQVFRGVAAIEKDVVLFGGESNVLTFTSDPNANYCDMSAVMVNTDPTAIVEVVSPIILGTKVVDCNCHIPCIECSEIPCKVQETIGENLVINSGGYRLYVSLGIFSVIRLVRDAQLLVSASDYSVPDKECTPAASNENPCALFKTMPFPTSQFKGMQAAEREQGTTNHKGGCGCNKS